MSACHTPAFLDAVKGFAPALELAHQADDLLLRTVLHEAGVVKIPAERRLALHRMAVPSAVGRDARFAEGRRHGGLAHVQTLGALACRQPGLQVHARGTGAIREDDTAGSGRWSSNSLDRGG